MDASVYIADEVVSLCAYEEARDSLDRYHAWQDPATESGYNSRSRRTYAEFMQGKMPQRWHATIVRNRDQARIGMIMLSPEDSPPDLAIILYAPYRSQGYGSMAFALGVRYCFDVLGLSAVYAGCYPENTASLRMLKGCGFAPHPEGDQQETHYLTGAPRVQLDFVIKNPAARVE